MTPTAKSSRSSTRHPRTAVAALAAVLAVPLVTGCSSSDSGTVVVGSNDFAESILIADIYGEALKAKGIKVTYRPNIGSRETTYGLMRNGSLTVLPEYNGALLAYLDSKAAPKTVATTTAAITAKLDSKLTLLEPASAQDKDSVTLNAATAARYGLTSESSIAGLKKAAPDLVIGGSPEFQTRQQGLLGLTSVYGLTFKSFKALDAGGSLTEAALQKNTVQAADIFTTDPMITQEGFVVLQDPENLFGFENVVPLVYKSGLSQEGVDALNAVSARLDTAVLLDLDTQVQTASKDPLAVAQAWLKSAGLD